jgi:hypothetical protein
MTVMHGPHGAFDYTHADYECGWDRVDFDDQDPADTEWEDE